MEYSSLIPPKGSKLDAVAHIKKWQCHDIQEWHFPESEILPIPLSYLWEEYEDGTRLYYIGGRKLYTHTDNYYE